MIDAANDVHSGLMVFRRLRKLALDQGKTLEQLKGEFSHDLRKDFEAGELKPKPKSGTTLSAHVAAAVAALAVAAEKNRSEMPTSTTSQATNAKATTPGSPGTARAASTSAGKRVSDAIKRSRPVGTSADDEAYAIMEEIIAESTDRR